MPNKFYRKLTVKKSKKITNQEEKIISKIFSSQILIF